MKSSVFTGTFIIIITIIMIIIMIMIIMILIIIIIISLISRVSSERLAKLKSNSILLIAIVVVYLVCNTPRSCHQQQMELAISL